MPGLGFYAVGKGLLPNATAFPSGLGLTPHIPWIAAGDGQLYREAPLGHLTGQLPLPLTTLAGLLGGAF